MQKRHRIFIAINLPKEVKRALAKYETTFSELPAKWTPPENLHITLVFLGDLTDVELGEVCVITKEVATLHEAVDINLTSIGYGPSEKLPPKMLWASGAKSQPLSVLKKDLEEALLEKIVNFDPDKKGFAPHVTLARISAFAWKAIEPEERPEVLQNLDLIFTAETIDVMESEIKKGGPQYTLIESIELK